MSGLGVDMVSVSGLRSQLKDPASVFADGTFTAGEQRYASQSPSGDPVRHLAARYAAKEALIKAWSSTRWARPPVNPHPDLREIEVVNDHYGRPALRLHGVIGGQLSGYQAQLSLSHDGDYAIAVVILSPSSS